MIFYQSELKKALATISAAINPRNVIQAMQGALIDVDNCTITGYNLEIGIVYPITIDKSMHDNISTFIIPPKLIALIPKLSDEKIEISVDNIILNVKNGKYKGKIQTLSANDYASTPDIICETKNIFFDFKKFQNAIKNITYAISENSQQESIKGMLLEIKNGILNLVGCDGYRLSMIQIPITQDDLTVIITKPAVLVLQKLSYNNKISISVSNNHICFTVDTVKVFSRILQGEYIDYNNIIPKNNKIIVTANVNDFISLIERFKIINSNDALKVPLKIQISDDTLTLTGKSFDNEFLEELKVLTSKNCELEIAVNCNFLLDMLKNIASETVKMAFDTSLSPIVCNNVSDNIEVDNNIVLVLPTRIKQ